MIIQNGRSGFCPQKPTFGLKLCFWLSVLALIPLFFVDVDFYMDHIEYTIYEYQLWRPFVAFFGQINPYFGILSIIIEFWWLRHRFPDSVTTFIMYRNKGIQLYIHL